MNARVLPRSAGDRLARVRLSPAQIQVAVVLCVILSVGSLSIAFEAFSSRVDVAREQAQHAVEQATATQQRVEAADCGLLDLLRTRPGDPPRTTAAGQLLAARADAAYIARGCPP
ncbi:hypothetical protein [Frankia sp. R82]|uniref:hypothetical protein n=1 Tax=Frankia sp. R82 TaxID=2950553 RepID=UPI002043F71B|nr:hypothetical protein [Frankia sp. R82]MCM3884172.1 hypothetical protein [Frankia sp. R82]